MSGSTRQADPDAPVTVAEAQAIMDSYDAANNPAVKAAHAPKYDEKAWKKVDSGPVLASDVFSTRLNKQQQDTSKPAPFTHDVTAAYGSTSRSSDGQAPWLLVTGIIPAVGNEGTPRDFAAVMVKESVGWRMWASLGGDLRKLPDPPEKIRNLTAAQRQDAANSIAALGRAIATGSVDGIGKGSAITEYRSALHKGLKHTEMTIEPRPWGTPVGTSTETATVVGTPAARLMRVGAVTLGLVSFENTVTFDSTDGAKFTLDPDYAAVEGGSTKPTSTAHRRTYQTMLVSIADGGKPTVFGSSDGLLAKAGT